MIDRMLFDFWEAIYPVQLCFFQRQHSVSPGHTARVLFVTSSADSVMDVVRDSQNQA